MIKLQGGEEQQAAMDRSIAGISLVDEEPRHDNLRL
jgi:hypothetical protein